MENSIVLSNKTEVILRPGDCAGGYNSVEVIFEDGWNYGHSYYIPKEDVDAIIAKLIEVKKAL